MLDIVWTKHYIKKIGLGKHLNRAGLGEHWTRLGCATGRLVFGFFQRLGTVGRQFNAI